MNSIQLIPYKTYFEKRKFFKELLLETKKTENLFGSTKARLYCITCQKTGKHYIGQSKNVNKCCTAHLNRLRNSVHDNRALQKDFNTYGEKKIFCI